MWSEIRRLIKERIKIAEGQETDIDNMSYTKLMTDYTIVVQELFVMKVKAFLDTVGKDKFNIQHYWVRYEFAKARGQIHAHLLAITGKEADGKTIQEAMAESQGNDAEQVKLLASWARERLGMTSIHPSTFTNGQLDLTKVGPPEGTENKDTSALETTYTCTPNLKNSRVSLVNTTMMHKCSDYCMREPKRRKPQDDDGPEEPNKRMCRAGFGVEIEKNSYRTPGHPLVDNDKFTGDPRGFRQLTLKRNTTRMLQTSMVALDAWRANCDVKILIYDTDPVNPDRKELARVTDYVVAYTCKGNASLQTEKDQLRDMVLG